MRSAPGVFRLRSPPSGCASVRLAHYLCAEVGPWRAWPERGRGFERGHGGLILSKQRSCLLVRWVKAAPAYAGFLTRSLPAAKLWTMARAERRGVFSRNPCIATRPGTSYFTCAAGLLGRVAQRQAAFVRDSVSPLSDALQRRACYVTVWSPADPIEDRGIAEPSVVARHARTLQCTTD